MSITSVVTIYNEFTGDIGSVFSNAAASNNASPAELITQRLTVGNNTITAPVTTGVTVTGLTILPPVANPTLITLKGVNGDTGIPIHKTNPTFIPLDATFVSLVLSVGTQIDKLRLIWS